jgi:hypothetical protein
MTFRQVQVKGSEGFKKRGCHQGRQPDSDQLDGQGVQTLVNEILQRIIHKAMALNARDPAEQRGCNRNPHVSALAAVVGAHVAGVCGAFIDHPKLGGLQAFGQSGMDLRA